MRFPHWKSGYIIRK